MLLRRRSHSSTDIPLFRWTGKLRARNLDLNDARQMLTFKEDRISFASGIREYSPYFDHFFQGATLVPRCVCFVEPAAEAVLNIKAPFLRTSEEAYAGAKKQWKLRVEGNVEDEFLFGTALARDLIPFVVRKLSLVVLPVIESSHGDLKMIESLTALGEGFTHAHDWFKRAERIWEDGRKDEKMEFAGRLDYQRLLTSQSLSAKFVVLTNKSGTNISAAFVNRADITGIAGITIRGFIADYVTYRYYARSEDEANYLVGILNTEFVNEAIKPLQTQGLMGERDITRRPFEACNIPIFDSSNELHREIAALSAAARAELLPFASKMPGPVAQARKFAREHVEGKLARLDELTRHVLNASDQPRRQKTTPVSQSELIL